jgi:hypothetical protein
MMVCGKTLGESNVHRFEFIFPAALVPSVVALAPRQDGQASTEQDLENLTSIILKDIIDPVHRGQFLEIPDAGP